MPPWVRDHNNLQLTLTHLLSNAAVATAAAALLSLLLLLSLNVLLISALLLLPDNTQRMSVMQKKAWRGGLPGASRSRVPTIRRYLGAGPS